MLDNGTNRCRAYGQYLGNRYRSFPNLIWLSGNDFQSWRTPGNDAVVRAVALGIRDIDTSHLQTSELDYLVSSSLDDTNWDPLLGLNGTYTYFPTYARLQENYNRTNFLPNFLVEANYEFESLQGPVTTAPILRRQEYWTMTSGACGQMYGNHYTWPFPSGWQEYLDTPGAIEIGYLKSFFEARAWFNLVPDTNHAVVTAGYGTYSESGHVADNDYLTDALAPDGSLAVIYTPIIRQFTVDMSQLAGPAAAHWFDPAGRHVLSGRRLASHQQWHAQLYATGNQRRRRWRLGPGIGNQSTGHSAAPAATAPSAAVLAAGVCHAAIAAESGRGRLSQFRKPAATSTSWPSAGTMPRAASTPSAIPRATSIRWPCRRSKATA